jgi:hypothetical protein
MSTSIAGSFSPTGEVSAGSETAADQNGESFNVGSLSCKMSGSAAASLNFTANVATPSVAAVGIGSNRAEWKFNRAEEPLFGRDIETWAVLVIPKGFEELRYRIRFSLTTRTLFFPTRRESDWTELTCVFADAKTP